MWGCWSEIGGSYIYTRVPQNLDFRLVLKGGARVAVPLIGHNSADGFRAGADARNGSKGGPQCHWTPGHPCSAPLGSRFARRWASCSIVRVAAGLEWSVEPQCLAFEKCHGGTFQHFNIVRLLEHGSRLPRPPERLVDYTPSVAGLACLPPPAALEAWPACALVLGLWRI
jgi:hypothetical protein